jgi:hypothetical protein
MFLDINNSPILQRVYACIKQHEELFFTTIRSTIRQIESTPSEQLVFPLSIKFSVDISGLENLALMRAHPYDKIDKPLDHYFFIIPLSIAEHTLHSLKIAIWLERIWDKQFQRYVLHAESLFKLNKIKKNYVS